MRVYPTGLRGAAIADLTDSTGGTANNALQAMADVGIDVILAADQTDVNDRLVSIRNNFADLAAKVNTIIATLEASNIVAS